MSRSARRIVKTPAPMVLVLSAAVLVLTPGCALMENGRRWGEDATVAPGWDVVSSSAIENVSSPRFLIPTCLALVLQIDDLDERVSRWATRHTPTSGSTRRAERTSSSLRSASIILYHASALATPGGPEPGPWLESKAKGYAVQLGAAALNNELVFVLKDACPRRRPLGWDDESFPSGHAANAAMFTTLASRNVAAMGLGPAARTSADVLLLGLAVAVAWERVEAGAHYPSDVLAGMAMGSLLAAFANDAFMGTNLRVGPQADSGGRIFAGFSVEF